MKKGEQINALAAPAQGLNDRLRIIDEMTHLAIQFGDSEHPSVNLDLVIIDVDHCNPASHLALLYQHA
jgi:hypothetical protein